MKRYFLALFRLSIYYRISMCPRHLLDTVQTDGNSRDSPNPSAKITRPSHTVEIHLRLKLSEMVRFDRVGNRVRIS